MAVVVTAPWPWLSCLIGLPVAAGGVLLALGEARARLAGPLAVLCAAATVLLAAWPLAAGFDPAAGLQWAERRPWIEAFGVHWAVAVDGPALALILLTAAMTLVVVLLGGTVAYLAAFLVLEGLLIGVFAAQDALLFYAFFEAMLLPMLVIIGVWGGPARRRAALKFFLYTFAGSVLFLAAVLYLARRAGGFDLAAFGAVALDPIEQAWLFGAFFLAFAVKVPMLPLHTWLPEAHVEAPTGGSVILAAITLKIGAWGFLRFALPITPLACAEFAVPVVALSLAAVVYVGLLALVQRDLKKLVAYSSIAHMGFVTLGLFLGPASAAAGAPDPQAALLGLQGAFVQMISHGLVSAALFVGVGVLYRRTHSRAIDAYGGLAARLPLFAALFTLFALANTAVPGTSGFVGEFLVLLGSWRLVPWWAAIAGSTLLLSAAYTLWMLRRVVFGPVPAAAAPLAPLDRAETVVLAALAAAVLILGLWPQPLLALIGPSLSGLVEGMSAP
ncbi:MAG: NADH dehydrogenase subunit M [Gammaproteobacteria bacterium]|nr:MAG: NADH dehydrogenase subunit M [Gammaproteobacteria bacterium]